MADIKDIASLFCREPVKNFFLDDLCNKDLHRDCVMDNIEFSFFCIVLALINDEEEFPIVEINDKNKAVKDKAFRCEVGSRMGDRFDIIEKAIRALSEVNDNIPENVYEKFHHTPYAYCTKLMDVGVSILKKRLVQQMSQDKKWDDIKEQVQWRDIMRVFNKSLDTDTTD